MEGRGRNDEKTILVAVQMDGNGRDLVDWAVGKAAEAGDRVLAVHVYRKSDIRNQTVSSLTKALNDYLSEYQNFCNTRQVFLIGRLAQGSSIRKTIVKEAEICGVNAVVVGVNNNAAFRGPASLSKYCSRKLPPNVSLFAVHNGKIIYERKAAVLPQGVGESTRTKILLPNLSMKSEGAISLTKDENGVEIASRATSIRGSVDDGVAGRINNNKSLRRKRESLRSLSLLVERFPQKPSGWPLLQRTNSMDLSARRGDEAARNMSVVQWVMSLPDRSQQSSQGSDASSSAFELENHPEYAELCKKLDAVLDRNSYSCRWYSRVELEESTGHFSPDNLIGNGGCSRVYRGSLSDGEEIAAKITKLSIESLREFVKETDIITTLQHDRIVRLKGICIDENDIISVYEFFSRGSLEENLHGKRAKTPMPWSARYKVALGTAEALNYMHTNHPNCVIHRDVKSSNILLSDDFEPQLADFGLAVWAPHASSNITYDDVVGTFGYLAPEYFMYGKVSDKMDVYSFGVVLLELVTGRKPICSEVSREHESLVMWVTKLVEQGDLTDLLHSSIEEECDKDQIRRMVLAASISIRRVARLRPSMSQVVALLRGEEEIESWVRSHSISTTEEEQNDDEEAYPPSSVASHLGVAFQDIDDAGSISSIEQNYHNLEEYLHGRCSRSSSFD